MATRPDQAHSPLAGDVVGPGFGKIAEAAGLPKRITRTMIEERRLPAFQIGKRWYARISEMQAVLTAANPDTSR